MNARIKKTMAAFLTVVMVLAAAIQSIAAPLSYAKPAAASEPAKITGTWSRDAAGSWHFDSQDGAAKDGWYYLNTTNKATEYNWFCFDANGVMRTGWVQDKDDPSVWYYAGETKDSSEGGLVKGWVTDPRDGKRYYMDPSTGIMRYGWQLISNVWYYFGEKQYSNASHPYGAMYVNERTPDGYYVGSGGAWIQNNTEDDSSDKPDPAPKTYYTVTFNMQGHGTQISPITGVVSGSKVPAPASPTADGFTFEGWYKEASCTNAWAFDTDKVTANTMLYAKWTQIQPESKTIEDILKTNPDFPVTADAAWENENGCVCYFDGEYLNISRSSDETSWWQINKINEVIESGNDYFMNDSFAGEPVKYTFKMTDNVLTGIEVECPAIMSTEMPGTYKPAAPGNKTIADILKTNPDFPVTADAAWENENGCVCYFDGEYLNISRSSDETSWWQINKINEVIESGNDYILNDSFAGEPVKYTFKMTDNVLTSIEVECPAIMSTEMPGTYTASAAPTEYIVTFDLNGITGTAPDAQTITSGEKAARPDDPADTNHTFAGWYKTKDAAGALSDPWDFDTDTVTADITLYAQWTRTLESLLATNPDIPSVTNISAPGNAWVNEDNSDCKGFIGNKGANNEALMLKNGDKPALACLITNSFTKIGEEYVFEYKHRDAFLGVFTLHMTNGKVTSVEYEYDRDNQDYIALSGTYTAQAPKKLTAVRPKSMSSFIDDSLPAIASPSDAQKSDDGNDIPEKKIKDEIVETEVQEIAVEMKEKELIEDIEEVIW